MPIVSGGGGGGGPAVGAYLPTAAPSGVTIDTTTYDNQIGSGKYTTLVFPEDNAVLAFAIDGDDFPRLVLGADMNNAGLAFADGTQDPVGGDAVLYLTGGGVLGFSNAPSLSAVLSASAAAGNRAITGLANPSGAQDAATKTYVDTAVVLPHTSETFAGSAVAIANGASTLLTWDGAAGTALLDVSVLAQPVMVTSGHYGVAVTVIPTEDLTAGGTYTAIFATASFTVRQSSAPAVATNLRPSVTLTIPSYISATTRLEVTVTNNDGAASRSFKILTATVQRFT